LCGARQTLVRRPAEQTAGKVRARLRQIHTIEKVENLAPEFERGDFSGGELRDSGGLYDIQVGVRT
jgi:hypothetical protein